MHIIKTKTQKVHNLLNAISSLHCCKIYEGLLVDHLPTYINVVRHKLTQSFSDRTKQYPNSNKRIDHDGQIKSKHDDQKVFKERKHKFAEEKD